MTTLEKIKTEIEAVEPRSHVQYGMRWADTTLMIPFHKVMHIIDKYAEQEPTSPCDLCRFNPPSSADGKPCTMCPAEKGGE